MALTLTETTVRSILTRTSGYLTTVSSHSLQPYRGCTFGNALCGVGCYVQHNPWVTKGRSWGSFLEVRTNAAFCYREQHARESAWARCKHGNFSIFMSSSTDPFLPHERRYGITLQLLGAMQEQPPDELVLQTHSHDVARHADAIRELAAATKLRVHISIESDRDRMPGLPPPPSSVADRLQAAAVLRSRGIRTIVTCAPLLPIENPDRFFRTVAEVADGVVLDHFVGGDGSRDGSRTRRTPLVAAIEQLDPAATEPDYLEAMLAVARRHMKGRIGIGIDGFAGRFSG